jgi:hypothetical protein
MPEMLGKEKKMERKSSCRKSWTRNQRFQYVLGKNHKIRYKKFLGKKLSVSRRNGKECKKVSRNYKYGIYR